jgi:Glycosyltransferase family 9 (heptosyltransferase)
VQLAYRIPPNRAQKGSRAAKWINPEKNELLIPDQESAHAQISALEKQLKGPLPKHRRAEVLIARAMIFEALGTPAMVEAAQDAWKATKTAITAHLMAVGYHHLGDIKTACSYYELAFRYPHEPGFNIDLAYTQALLFQGKWTEAHKQTLKLKKRMVYAAYLPEWDGKPCKELSVISEGGFGDIIHCGRWIPILREMCEKVIVYLPTMFFESGFVDLMRRQPWCPEIKILTDTPQHVPAVGFFDLPAKFNVQPNSVPPSLTFQPRPYILENVHKRPLVGICWAARAMETPLCPAGVYRSLTEQQAEKILTQADKHIQFVSLQLGEGEKFPNLLIPKIKNWEDTAGIIAGLDAVVTVDTAIAHLAAAMNKPTYVLLSGAIDWKFGLDDTKCRWYPSMQLFKNNAFGFDNAVSNLIEFINNGKFHNPSLRNRSECQTAS